MYRKSQQSGLTDGELQRLDAVITVLQEQGVRLGDDVKAQSDVCCCGAVTAEAHGKFVFNEHDRELVTRILDLERQFEGSPTLGDLIEVRGELLRERIG